MTERFKIPLNKYEHEISAESMIPEGAEALVIFAHGAGAGMDHKFMWTVADDLAKRGIGTLRFNFLYMETGRKSPDRAAVSLNLLRDVINFARANYDLELFLGGKSYGGRMSSMVMSEENPPQGINGLIFWGYPLHAPGRPGLERAAHLPNITVPMLFLQGTRDKLAELDLIAQVSDSLELADLHIVEGADHGFHVLKSSGRSDEDVFLELGDAAAEFIKNS